MNPTAYALIRVLLAEIAPTWRAEIRLDPRVTVDPGLRAATTILESWLADLRKNREAALEADRVAEALRRAFVCAASRGRVCVPTDHADPVWIEIPAPDMALVEVVREIAASLDAVRGTSVATDNDAHREDLLTRAFDLARAATNARRSRHSIGR